jgi:hypothetical protein
MKLKDVNIVPLKNKLSDLELREIKLKDLNLEFNFIIFTMALVSCILAYLYYIS